MGTKLVGYVINMFFIVVCFVHILKVIYLTAFPAFPETRMYGRQLKDMEFPLAFIICVSKEGVSNDYQVSCHSCHTSCHTLTIRAWDTKMRRTSSLVRASSTSFIMAGLDILRMDPRMAPSKVFIQKKYFHQIFLIRNFG